MNVLPAQLICNTGSVITLMEGAGSVPGQGCGESSGRTQSLWEATFTTSCKIQDCRKKETIEQSQDQMELSV